jgi:tight adherence protein B
VIDYNIYLMDRREKTKYMALGAVGCFGVGMIFFSNVIIALVFTGLAYFYPEYKAREIIKTRKTELSLQFRDALYSLSSSLGAGRSLESAFKTALNDLRILYPDKTTYIIREFEFICRRIELNQPVEEALFDFAKRSGLEDIRNFADVIVICRRTGGNLVQVIKNTSNIISDKMGIRHDIEMNLTKQKYEQKILNLMPLIFIAMIKFGGSGYMDSLYTSLKGYLLMALALAIIVASYVISRKIFDIRM